MSLRRLSRIARTVTSPLLYLRCLLLRKKRLEWDLSDGKLSGLSFRLWRCLNRKNCRDFTFLSMTNDKSLPTKKEMTAGSSLELSSWISVTVEAFRGWKISLECRTHAVLILSLDCRDSFRLAFVCINQFYSSCSWWWCLSMDILSHVFLMWSSLRILWTSWLFSFHGIILIAE